LLVPLHKFELNYCEILSSKSVLYCEITHV